MDSLGGLSDTLPRGSAMEATEKELQTAFRQSALALTGLFKVGKKATRRAYIAGKKEALQDVLEFLQASLDHPLVHSETLSLSGPPGQLNVARLIDYICARQETLQAEEEGDQDEEEASTAPAPHNPTNQSTSNQHSRPSAGGSSRSASSLFASRSSAAASTAASTSTSASTSAPLRPQSAPPSRPTIATSPIVSTSAPSSPPLSTSTTPQFRNHPAPFAAQRPSLFSQSSATASAPSSPLASGSMTPTSTSGLGSGTGTRRRSNVSSGANPNPARKGANGRSSSSTSGSRDRSSNIDASAGSSSASSSSAVVDAALSSSVGAMKRRFHTVSVADLVDLELQQESGPAAVVLAKPAASSAAEGAELDAHQGDGSEDIDMEMDGWDGVGERPPKRVLRTR